MQNFGKRKISRWHYVGLRIILLNNVANLQKNLNLSLEEALSAIGKSVEDYEKAKKLLG